MTKIKRQPIKPRQQEILVLLHKFRFLNRKQIQSLLNHKYHRLVQEWLNELILKKYISQFYDNKVAPQPAVYSLDKNGRRYLRKTEKIRPRKTGWRDAKLSQVFRDHCLFLANINLSLLALTTKNKTTLDFKTKTELAGIKHLIQPPPDAFFSIKGKAGAKRYFLDVFDDIPPIALRKRVKQYFEYFDSDEWQDNTGKPFPEVILICPNNRIKGHLYYFIQNKIDDDSELVFYLATHEEIKIKGLGRDSLHKVVEKE